MKHPRRYYFSINSFINRETFQTVYNVIYILCYNVLSDFVMPLWDEKVVREILSGSYGGAWYVDSLRNY